MSVFNKYLSAHGRKEEANKFYSEQDIRNVEGMSVSESHIKVMKIKEMITNERSFWSVNKFFFFNTLGNVYRTVWRIYILMLGCKGLILSRCTATWYLFIKLTFFLKTYFRSQLKWGSKLSKQEFDKGSLWFSPPVPFSSYQPNVARDWLKTLVTWQLLLLTSLAKSIRIFSKFPGNCIETKVQSVYDLCTEKT